MEIQKIQIPLPITKSFLGNNQFSSKTKLELFQEKYIMDENTGCWNWIARKNPKGYGQFHLGKTIYQAHRASWVLYKGEIPEGLWVLHICDNPSCVNPNHLFLGTNDDNMKDMARKGRSTRGERSHTCKINEDIVKEIRNSKETAKQLSKKFGLSVYGIYQVKYRKTWKWVK